MQIVVLTNDALKEELQVTGVKEGTEIKWIAAEKEFLQPQNADAFFDLLFHAETQRIEILKSLHPTPVFINDVPKNNPANNDFIRINGWPSFLNRNIMEASCTNKPLKAKAETIISSLNRKMEWTPDIPGFISGRVLAMIINEAYFALGEGVSSKKDIDTAMKLGTNYPFGPFEWSQKIGLKNIYSLLVELSKTSKRYEPAPLLGKESLE